MPWSDDALPARGHLSVEIIGRRVRCPRDMFRWERSAAMADVAAFVEHMNAVAKRGPPATGGGVNVDEAARVLSRVAGWAAEHEPARGGGALAARRCFREFHGRLRTDGRDLLMRAFATTPGDHRAVELPVYLEHGFGDPDAAAYGPQHELSFCMYLIALFKLHRLTFADEPYVVPVLFNRYLDVVDYLVHRYRLEPSCEFGDAGLDDYRYVGFLWGSAQLAADDPSGCSPADVIADGGRPGDRDGLFAKCVAAAARRRTAPTWRRSYQLWNLSACARWSRVNGCLMAAFRPQVLGRFRVARHLMFGELLGFARNPRPPGVSFYDCIPAAAAAMAVSKTAVAVAKTAMAEAKTAADEAKTAADEAKTAAAVTKTTTAATMTAEAEDCDEDERRHDAIAAVGLLRFQEEETLFE